jgi:poly-beta-1,6-N-acetyl-D-glucosamine N-deacetylase
MAKRILKLFLLCIFGSFLFVSSLSAFRPTDLYRDQVAVLMYHHVSDEITGSSTISTKQFRSQLAYLKNKGYQFITLGEFKHFMQGGPVVDNAVLVTFDDGYESYAKKAVPVLRKKSIPSVNFIITGTLDDPLSGTTPFMGKPAAKALDENSLIDLQCHTDRLHGKIADGGKAMLVGRMKTNGKDESDEAYKKRILEDTRACIGALQELSPKPADSLAYPYGIYDEKSAALLHEAGIKYAFTVMPKMATRDMSPMKIPRINAGSPFVTPEGLDNSIMRRVSKVAHPFDRVALRDTVEQIGGEVFAGVGGSLVIHYNGGDWSLIAGSAEVEHNGHTLLLDQALKVSGRRCYISLRDLEKLLYVKIYLDPVTNTFTTQLPDSSEADGETKPTP